MKERGREGEKDDAGHVFKGGVEAFCSGMGR